MTELPEGILLVHKPKGITSFDVVQQIRKKYSLKALNTSCRVKVGHAGTLDPLATGLLIVGVGEGTKQLKQFVDATKVYEAEICIGEKSATGDAEGPITESVTVTDITKEHISNALTGMIGVLRIEVSIYSAMKRGGEAYYKKARRGEQVTPPVRDMEVIEAVLTNKPEYKNDHIYVHIRFTVGSGTYVRSLAEELGKRLGYPARLEDLCRTQVGKYTIDNATLLEDFHNHDQQMTPDPKLS